MWYVFRMTLDWIFGGPLKWFLSSVHSAIGDMVFIQNEGVKKPINIYVAKCFNCILNRKYQRKYTHSHCLQNTVLLFKFAHQAIIGQWTFSIVVLTNARLAGILHNNNYVARKLAYNYKRIGHGKIGSDPVRSGNWVRSGKYTHPTVTMSIELINKTFRPQIIP